MDDFKDGLNKIVIKSESAEQELLSAARMSDVDGVSKADIFNADDDEDELDDQMNMRPSALADTFVAPS